MIHFSARLKCISCIKKIYLLEGSVRESGEDQFTPRSWSSQSHRQPGLLPPPFRFTGLVAWEARSPCLLAEFASTKLPFRGEGVNVRMFKRVNGCKKRRCFSKTADVSFSCQIFCSFFFVLLLTGSMAPKFIESSLKFIP